MQSTAMVALRTTIMMVCLVAVPLAAVMGTALPRFLTSLLDGRGKSSNTRRSLAMPDKHIEVAGNQPVSSADLDEPVGDLPSDEATEGLRPTAHITAVRPAADSPSPRRAEAKPPAPVAPLAAVTGVHTADAAPAAEQTAPFWGARRAAASAGPRYSTAHYESSDAGRRQEPKSAAPLNDGEQADRLRQGLHQPKLLKTGYSVGGDAAELAAERPLVKVDRDLGQSALPPDRPNDPFATSEERLRELGATYYRLEAWGDRGEFYRCACDIRLGPRSRAARHFEAIEPTASEAVAAVIAQVERHSGRTRRRP